MRGINFKEIGSTGSTGSIDARERGKSIDRLSVVRINATNWPERDRRLYVLAGEAARAAGVKGAYVSRDPGFRFRPDGPPQNMLVSHTAPGQDHGHIDQIFKAMRAVADKLQVKS